jgi:hypothetical protein
MEQNLNDISNPAFCDNIENKYNKLLLNSDEKTELFNKIMKYYQLKSDLLKKSKTVKKCPICGQKSDETSININKVCSSTYNTTTYCKELHMKCIAKKKCGGMYITYGVAFNVQNQVNENKKILEFIKHKIIINKNNLLFGLISEQDGIKIHEKLLNELKSITDTYKIQLYHVLFYTNNQRMNKDIQQLRTDLTQKIIEIKEYVNKANYEKVIDNYIEINKLYKCLVNLNKYKITTYTEQLFKCGDPDQPIDPELMPPPPPKHTIPDFNTIQNITNSVRPSSTNRRTGATKSTNNALSTTKNSKKIEKIEHLLNHMNMIFDDNFIDQLLQEDPAFIEQLYTEMTELTNLIKYATPEQNEKYETVRVLYETKLKELGWSPDQIKKDEDDDDDTNSGNPRPLIIEPFEPVTDNTNAELNNKFELDAIPL